MDMHVMKCPQCHADLEVEDGIDSFYCLYCGSKVVVGGMTDAAYKAKSFSKGMDTIRNVINDRYAHKRYVLEQNRIEQEKNQKMFFPLFVILFMLPVLFFGGAYLHHRSRIKELRQTETEISQLINSGNYDAALVKANELYYDEEWSDDEEKVWNTKRENYISMILDKKRENSGDKIEYIKVPDSSKKLVGKKYSDVVDKFKKAGFTNVRAMISSAEQGLFDWDNTVEHITISGKETFAKEDEFDKNSAVIIYYFADD